MKKILHLVTNLLLEGKNIYKYPLCFLNIGRRNLPLCFYVMISVLIFVKGLEVKAEDYKVIFIIDKSGSMGEKTREGEQKLSVIEKEVLKQAQQYSKMGIETEIYAFDTEVYKCDIAKDWIGLLITEGPGHRPLQRRKPLKYRGNTDVKLALLEAMKHLDDVNSLVVYLYTDGQDTVSRPKVTFEELLTKYKDYLKMNKKWGLYYVTLGFKESEDFTKQIIQLDGQVIQTTPERPHQWAIIEGAGIEFIYEGRIIPNRDMIETSDAKISTRTPPTFSNVGFDIEAQFVEAVPGGAFLEILPDKPLTFGETLHRLKLRVHNPGKLKSKKYPIKLTLSCPNEPAIIFQPSPEITGLLEVMLGKSEISSSKDVNLGIYLPGSTPNPSSQEIEKWKIVIQNDDGAKKLNRNIKIDISSPSGLDVYITQENKNERITELTTKDDGNLTIVIPRMPEKEGSYELKVDFVGELFNQGKESIKYNFWVEKGSIKVNPKGPIDFGQILPTKTGSSEITISSVNKLAEGQEMEVGIRWDKGDKKVNRVWVTDENGQEIDLSNPQVCPTMGRDLNWQVEITCDAISEHLLRGAFVFRALDLSTLSINGAESIEVPFNANIQLGRVSIQPTTLVDWGGIEPGVVSLYTFPISLTMENTTAKGLQLEIYSDWKDRREEDKIWVVDDERETELTNERKVIVCSEKGEIKNFKLKVTRLSISPKSTEGSIIFRSREGSLLLLNEKEEIRLKFRVLTELCNILIEKDGYLADNYIDMGVIKPKGQYERSFTAELSEQLSPQVLRTYGENYKITINPSNNMVKFGILKFEGLQDTPISEFNSTKNVYFKFRGNKKLVGDIFSDKKYNFSFLLNTDGPFGINPSEFKCEFTAQSWISQNQWVIPVFLALFVMMVGLIWYYNHGPRLHGELLVAGQTEGTRISGLRKVYIGSGPGNLITLDENSDVAKKHARVYMKGNEVYIEHLAGSQYETLVDGAPITELVPLRPGSEVKIGNQVLTYQDIEETELEDEFTKGWSDFKLEGEES